MSFTTTWASATTHLFGKLHQLVAIQFLITITVKTHCFFHHALGLRWTRTKTLLPATTSSITTFPISSAFGTAITRATIIRWFWWSAFPTIPRPAATTWLTVTGSAFGTTWSTSSTSFGPEPLPWCPRLSMDLFVGQYPVSVLVQRQEGLFRPVDFLLRKSPVLILVHRLHQRAGRRTVMPATTRWTISTITIRSRC
jgi:hypothetical protein